MPLALKVIGRIGLALTILPSVLFLFGMVSLPSVKLAMLLGTIMWMGTAPIVQKMNKEA